MYETKSTALLFSRMSLLLLEKLTLSLHAHWAYCQPSKKPGTSFVVCHEKKSINTDITKVTDFAFKNQSQ